MNTLFHFLILTLALSYDQLPSFLSVEARKLTNSNAGTFTIDLIHRDSLLSPEERQKRLAAFGSVSTYREENDVKSTDITPSDGDYLMKIAIGTPPFEFMAIADTGSDLIWLQCSACKETKTCIQQQSPFFDPTKSSTYQPIDCNSPSCNYPDVRYIGCGLSATNQNNTPCLYDNAYGDGTNTTGILSMDTITLPSSDAAATLPSSVFGCGYIQYGSVSNGNGIIGLGNGPLSLVSQLGPKINYKFSYCLVPLSSGATSKLKFGDEVITGPKVVSTPYMTKQNSHHYYLTLDGINIGDTLVPVSQDIVIDSGTTLTFLETSVYNSVKDALKKAIGLSPVPRPRDSDLCYDQTQQESLNPPDMLFHFRGADVVLKAQNVFWNLEDVTCLAMVPSDDIFIFGNIAQVNFEVAYDLQAKQVSFAPTDCTTY